MPRESYDIVDRVVRTVYYQTSPNQPNRIPAHKVVMILSGNGSEEEYRVREALDEAVEAGRLERDEEHVWIPEE